MSMIGLKVPADVVEKLLKIKVPGKKVPDDSYHITMFYFEKEFKIKDMMNLIKLVHDVIKNVEPFQIKGKKVSCFPKGEDGVPIIIPVESEGLMELRKRLAKKFDASDFQFSKKYPEYRPHLTLAYSSKDGDEKDVDGIRWKATEIVIWGGPHDDEQIVISIPFKFGKRSGNELSYLYAEAFENLVARF